MLRISFLLTQVLTLLKWRPEVGGFGKRVMRNKFLLDRLHTFWSPRFLKLNLSLIVCVCVLRCLSPLLEVSHLTFFDTNFPLSDHPSSAHSLSVFTLHRLSRLGSHFPSHPFSWAGTLCVSWPLAHNKTLTVCCTNNPRNVEQSQYSNNSLLLYVQSI